MKRGPKRQPLTDKFEILPNGCWQWRRATMDGYGYTRDYEVDDKQRRAHRVMYVEIVTSGVNTMRGEAVSALNARKTHCIRGHLLGGDNLYLNARRRHCRACRRLQKGRAA